MLQAGFERQSAAHEGATGGGAPFVGEGVVELQAGGEELIDVRAEGDVVVIADVVVAEVLAGVAGGRQQQ